MGGRLARSRELGLHVVDGICCQDPARRTFSSLQSGRRPRLPPSQVIIMFRHSTCPLTFLGFDPELKVTHLEKTVCFLFSLVYNNIKTCNSTAYLAGTFSVSLSLSIYIFLSLSLFLAFSLSPPICKTERAHNVLVRQPCTNVKINFGPVPRTIRNAAP